MTSARPRLVAGAGCPVVLMHHQGPPETMQQAPPTTGRCCSKSTTGSRRGSRRPWRPGSTRDRIIVDPGIGFGKTVQHNLELMNGLALLHGLGCPIMLGASRKRMIGALVGRGAGRRGGWPARSPCALKAAEQGAQLLRVHDVPETVQALRVWRGLRDAALTPG